MWGIAATERTGSWPGTKVLSASELSITAKKRAEKRLDDLPNALATADKRHEDTERRLKSERNTLARRLNNNTKIFESDENTSSSSATWDENNLNLAEYLTQVRLSSKAGTHPAVEPDDSRREKDKRHRQLRNNLKRTADQIYQRYAAESGWCWGCRALTRTESGMVSVVEEPAAEAAFDTVLLPRYITLRACSSPYVSRYPLQVLPNINISDSVGKSGRVLRLKYLDLVNDIYILRCKNSVNNLLTEIKGIFIKYKRKTNLENLKKGSFYNIVKKSNFLIIDNIYKLKFFINKGIDFSKSFFNSTVVNKEVKKVLYKLPLTIIKFKLKYFLLITKKTGSLSLYINNILKKLSNLIRVIKVNTLRYFKLLIYLYTIYSIYISINNKTFKGNIIGNNNNKILPSYHIVITFTLYFKIIIIKKYLKESNFFYNLNRLFKEGSLLKDITFYPLQSLLYRYCTADLIPFIIEVKLIFKDSLKRNGLLNISDKPGLFIKG
ncbi:hypothetical protein B0T21DRAFT_344578 [Apiosordaria backusii]|uniref:Uncharacterized protein n=1 Tax=Apiosordaria backusii TaxID=314023 RepID=A0AA40K3D4_9PEZI|nr:hypothetical protein B0T21DRAFT_344578 [Apiosordaria backusii]